MPPELEKPQPGVHYPESDGQPVAETDVHRDLMFDLIRAVDHYFHDDPSLYASGNLFVYHVKDEPEHVVAPDVFVTRGVPRGRRRIYKVWEEGKPPDLAIELTSENTYREDLGPKREVYARIGVKEYVIFDPEGKRLLPPFRCYRLQRGQLVEVPPGRGPNGELVFRSDVLGLELRAAGVSLRWFDPRSGRALPVPDEYAALVRASREQADAERRARETAQQEAGEERRAHEEARREADAERRAREQAEAECERLRAELERLRTRKEG